ncbi:hypothetical protein CC80DRAFT_574395 [Byssothecium circinans]|uniref:Uncharacterized protein n=1 Tax=Byssothecium circinans TaxID=147558 RepID=A0A6A5UCV9_9PLEO|nr:hypothetical protein CC80DRAFT_574395 [Byssothecium circinans]
MAFRIMRHLSTQQPDAMDSDSTTARQKNMNNLNDESGSTPQAPTDEPAARTIPKSTFPWANTPHGSATEPVLIDSASDGENDSGGEDNIKSDPEIKTELEPNDISILDDPAEDNSTTSPSTTYGIPSSTRQNLRSDCPSPSTRRSTATAPTSSSRTRKSSIHTTHARFSTASPEPQGAKQTTLEKAFAKTPKKRRVAKSSSSSSSSSRRKNQGKDAGAGMNLTHLPIKGRQMMLGKWAIMYQSREEKEKEEKAREKARRREARKRKEERRARARRMDISGAYAEDEDEDGGDDDNDEDDEVVAGPSGYHGQ